MAEAVFRIRKDGQGSGGFLCPPGHPNHEYVLYGYWPRGDKPVKLYARKAPDMIGSIEGALAGENDMPESVRAQARRIMDAAELACSEAWVRNVYGYFRNSYSPDGVDRNVSNAVSTGKVYCACGEEFWNRKGLDYHLGRDGNYPQQHYEVAKPLPPAEHHLGYLAVKEYFPDHQPRTDLIKDPGRGYGNWPCDKCGTRVQYEARKDAWCKVTSGSRWTYDPTCPAGGQHEVAPTP